MNPVQNGFRLRTIVNKYIRSYFQGVKMTMGLFSQILNKALGRNHSHHGHGHYGKQNKKMLVKGIATVAASKIAKKLVKKILK